MKNEKIKIYYIVFYIVLSFIKFFTSMVDFRMEEAPLLVLKSPFALGNFIQSGEDRWLMENWTYDKWYARGEFVVLLKTSGSELVINIYRVIICLWLVSTVALILIIIFNVVVYIKKIFS